MNLGELIVELSADTAQLEKSLEQAKKKAYEAASFIEKSFDKINLEVSVDDDSLTDLNKHLNLKVQHLKEVNKYFSNNPIVVNVDDDSLTDLNKHLNLKVQHLKEVNKYFNSNPIVVNTDVTKLDELEERLGKLSNKTITITVESELSKQLEKSLVDAVQSAVKDAVSETTATSQQQTQKESSSKTQKVDVVASPLRSIIDGAFEGAGRKLTKGIDSSIENAIGVSLDDMSRISSNMILRYFGVGKKAQSDPKNEQKKIEAIVKDGISSFIKSHDSRTTGNTRRRGRVSQNDDIGADIEAAINSANQNNSGFISGVFSEVNKSFSESINISIESIAQKAKIAAIRQAKNSINSTTENTSVQSAVGGFFNALESNNGNVTKSIRQSLAAQSKKAVESVFTKLLPNTSSVVNEFLKTGVTPKKSEPTVKSSSDVLKEAAADLKNAAKALSDAAIKVKPDEPTAKTSKSFVAETITDPWQQEESLLPRQLPVKQNKVVLPPPQKRELESIPVNIPEEIKPLFKTIQSEIIKNIDKSEGYKAATESESLTPLPTVLPSKVNSTKKYAQTSLDSIEQALAAINKYFSDEYKKIKEVVKHATSNAGTKEDISAARSEVSNFVSRSKEAISTIDKYVKTGEDAGFSKDINSDLSQIHAKGKSSISRNTSSAESSLGKLNLADKKLFDQQLKGYVAQAEKLGIEVDAGLKKGIQHGAGGVSDAARAMLDDLIRTVESKMEIQSPSKVMIAIGWMIASGLAVGIEKGITSVSSASNSLTNVVSNNLKNIKSPEILSQLTSAVKKDFGSDSVIGNLFNSVTSALSKGGGLKEIGINLISSFSQGFLSGNSGTLGTVISFAKGIISAVKKVFRIASPSGEGIDTGENYASSHGKGIDNKAHVAVEAAKNMANAITNTRRILALPSSKLLEQPQQQQSSAIVLYTGSKLVTESQAQEFRRIDRLRESRSTIPPNQLRGFTDVNSRDVSNLLLRPAFTDVNSRDVSNLLLPPANPTPIPNPSSDPNSSPNPFSFPQFPPLPDMLNDYLDLGRDLATNIFTAVSNSIKQSTLSGYASLGQVMRNAVNAALFSLADTLKEPLYRSLLSQTRSMLPWFLKFIPRTFQLLPIFKPLLPVFGGLALGLGNSIVKNLMGNDVLKPGGFLTKLLSSITRIDLTSLSGQGTHGVMGLIAKMMNPVPNVIGAAGAGGIASLGLGLFGPFMNTFSGILGLDPSTQANPKKRAATVDQVLQEQIKSNRKKAGLSDAKGSQASRELIENIGNKTVDSVLENLNIPMIPTSVIQGMTGNKIKQQSGEIANAIDSIGVYRSKAEQLLEKTIKSGRKDVATRADILTRQVLRERGYSTSVRNAMSSEDLEKARRYISNTPLAASDNERKLMQAMGDIEESRVRLGDVKANRELDRLTAKVLLERGGTLKDYRNVKKSGELDILRGNLLNSINTTGVVGRLTQAYASNDQEALKSLLLQGLRKAGMSSEQLQNIDPKILNTATAGLMATLTGLQAKFKEKGFDMGKALTQGFKDSVRNLANAKDDLEYNAKKAIGKANFGDAVGLIFRRMTRGTVATQDQFKEMYNQMGAGLKKTLFSSPKQADEMFPNVLQFMGSIAATLAPVTTLFASLTPLFLPLAPIIGGIGAAVNMVAPHITKLIDGIQRVEVLQRRFTFLGGSKAGGEAEFKYAKDIAAKMNVPSEVAANSYSQLAIAARDSKMEGQGVKDLFEGITASLSALGISGQDASLVFMAYTQILAKGKLSMEELRQQLGEKFPPAMGVFAKAMGVSVPEMNALVQSGSVLSQDILPKVAKVLKQDYGDAAANQAGGLVVALNKLGNVGFEITTIFTDKLGGTLGWFVSTFADGLSLLSSTLGTLIPLGQSFAIGFAATIAIGLTTIMTKAKPLVVLFGSLQNLLMATFSVITTNMMPMIVGVTADVADNWLGAEKDLIKNMMDGITNAVLATFSTIDSAMRSMSDGNLSFSSMFGGLVQGAEQAGNIIDWLKGIFKGFFSIIPPGFVELLAMVFMFEQGTGLAVMALLPALKGFIGAFTGMVGSTAKAFMGFMTSMKVATELMMTSMGSAMAASEARIKIFSATMGFLRTALTHVAVAFGILMFSKGDFSNPMGDSLSKVTKELNNGLTEIRANVQKTADSFDKATNSVSKLGGTLADALPSKGVQLDIRSFWGGGDFKWDDAIKERNKRKSSNGSYMDALGLFGLGVAGAGAGFAASFGSLGVFTTALLGLISPVVGAFAPVVLVVAGFAAAVTAAVVALDLFAPKLTESQKGLIERNKLGNYFDVNDNNARLTNAQQQILKYFEDQEKNIRNLKEFSASQGLTGKSTDFVATIKPLTTEQQDRFNSTPEIAKLNKAIKENNKTRLDIIAEKISSGASPQEIKELKNSSGFKNLENKSKEMRNAVALASATFQISDTSENQKAAKDLDEEIRNKQAKIDKRRAAITRGRNLTTAYSTDGFAISIGDTSDLGTKQLEDDINALKEQKKNQQKIINASVQRAFSFEEIKKINKKLADATKKSVELDKALPSDKVRTEQGAIKLVIQQLYKQRQELVDSFGSPLPMLEKQLRLTEERKQKLRMGEVEGVPIDMIPQAVAQEQQKIDLLKKRIAAIKPFDVRPLEEALYTQAINAINDVTAKFERNSSINRAKSSLSQAKVYSRTGTSQQIAPDLANIQLADLGNQGKLLEEKVKTGQAALDKISQAIVIGGTNLDEARAKYKEVLENLTKDREALAQNTLEIAKVQREVRQTLIDQTKQVADYYRTSVREAQSVSIEFEKAKKTLEGSQLQNKLRAALIGAGDNIYTQFIEGIINIISQTTEMEKKRLDEKKQQYDYQNNVDDIKLRASELQRSLPGKIVPFDENKIKDFDEQLKIVQGSVIGINTYVQQVVTSLGQDAVLATNQLNDAFQGLGTTVAEVGTKLDTTLDKLTSTLDSLKVGTNDLSPQNAPNWAAGALDILGQMDNATPGTAPTIPATTPTIPSAPSPATNFVSPVKNTTIQDLVNYKPTFGQSVMGSRPKGRIHNKVDFDSRAKAGAGAEILASLPGVATGKLWKGNDGAVFVNSVLPSGTKITIEYGHLSVESIKKALGGALEKSVQVQAGQKLGNVLGDHLDFGVKANGRYINPQVFLSNLARGDYGAIANQPPATSKVKSGATVQNANKGESLVRIQRLGEKDEYGLEKLHLAVIKRGKLIDSFIVNSGNPRTQIFGGAGETKAGSKRPFEFGSYTLGKTVPAGNKKKMGNELIRIEPNFETERTAIGFHIDKDRLIDPGSSGCIVFANEAEFNKFKQALKTSGIKNIVFDQAVGAVEVAKVITGKVARSSNNSIPGTSRITQGGNDLSAEEYAKLTPLGKKLYELRRNPNVLALANAVARAEGTDFRKNSENFGYGMLIGGANVKDFSTHPFVGTGRKPIWIPGINNSSTASGRYQMMNFNASIQAAKKQFGKDAMPDMFKLIDFQGKDQPGFSPGLQDLYFIGSLLQRGVLDDVVAGKIDSSVLNKLAPHYASIGLGNKRSAYSGQGTPQGKHDNFLKFYQQNLGKLNQIVMTGGAVNPDKLQGLVTEAANLNLGATATRNSTNEMNNEAQRLTDEVQQLLGIYRLLRQTEEAGFSALSGMKDLNLDFVKTIAEGLSPSGLSSLERFNIAYGELVRSLEKKRESLEKTIRDTQGTVDNKPLLKAAFESALQKFPTAELALKAIKANDRVFEIAVLQNQQAKKMLSDYDASIPKILDAFKGKFSFDEQLRLSGIAIQNEKSGVALLQKQIEQRKLLQQLDPLDTKSARTAELEANIALLNADLDLREKLNNISRQENTKEISPEKAKEQRNLAQQENAITKENIQLKLEAEKITERTNNANKLLERSQFIQDSFKGVLEARSSVLKAYGLDFRAEKIDKQVAITNQQFDFAKASIQLDDFIRKNEKATGANKLTNEQINELRENLRLTNEYKLEGIKQQFSELGSVVKGVTGSFKNGFKEFLVSTKDIGKASADLFDSVAKGLIDSLADIASKLMTNALFGWVVNLFAKGIGLSAGTGLGAGGSFVGDVLPNTSFNMAFAGGMVGELPTFGNGGIVGALNKERSLTGRIPHVIVASEGERVLNHKETAIWNKLQGGIAGFASGGVVGSSNGNIASRIGSTTTINVPVSVAVGSDSDVDTQRLSQAVQAMVSDGIRREMRVGGSINRGNPYGR